MKKKRAIPSYEDLNEEQFQAYVQQQQQKISQLLDERKELEKELSELSARKAYLNEISEENKRLLSRKSLL
jgi:cell division protein FtsB